ncbi:MAG: MBOAT family protein [Bacteroidaceae bacterium]|nr:MBOAT family protein [Bacteroidaceae bacterium]
MAAGYFLYGYADLKFLPLLFGITVVYFFLGKWMGKTANERTSRLLNVAGVVLGVGLLVYFKYLNFFIVSFAQLFGSMGLQVNVHTLNIIMPLGISFFVFRLISYVVDIHLQKTEATDDFLAFATYVSFFPCIMAGPIDRPGFMKQLQKGRDFDYDKVVDGCRQFLWGMLKKVAVADNIAGCVNNVWVNDTFHEPGGYLLVTALLYSFQMYMDFSGYSDMAIGVGKTLGLKVAKNFNYPFFAVNVADYWRRWHMSLTSWLTDYVFMPLNVKFRNMGQAGMILAIVINLVLVGMWHGDNWTYAVFGLYHGLLFIPLILSGAFFKKGKIKTGHLGLPCLKDAGRILLTFLLVTIGLVIFRADSVGRAFEYLASIFTNGVFSFSLEPKHWQCILCIFAVMCVEWKQRNRDHGLELSGIRSNVLKYAIYLAIVGFVLVTSTDASSFIYAQF